MFSRLTMSGICPFLLRLKGAVVAEFCGSHLTFCGLSSIHNKLAEILQRLKSCANMDFMIQIIPCHKLKRDDLTSLNDFK